MRWQRYCRFVIKFPLLRFINTLRSVHWRFHNGQPQNQALTNVATLSVGTTSTSSIVMIQGTTTRNLLTTASVKRVNFIHSSLKLAMSASALRRRSLLCQYCNIPTSASSLIMQVGSTTNTSMFVVQGNGSVGIGTTTLLSTFVVQASSSLASAMSVYGSNGTSYFSIGVGNLIGIGTSTGSSVLFIRATSSTNTLPLLTIASSSSGISPYLTVLANGNVGISTSTPIATLAITGRGTSLLSVIASSRRKFRIYHICRNFVHGIAVHHPWKWERWYRDDHPDRKTSSLWNAGYYRRSL